MKNLNIKFLTLLGIIGCILVSLGQPLNANLVWGFSNPFMALYNHKIEQREMAAMFAIYTIIAWYGIYNLW